MVKSKNGAASRLTEKRSTNGRALVIESSVYAEKSKKLAREVKRHMAQGDNLLDVAIAEKNFDALILITQSLYFGPKEETALGHLQSKFKDVEVTN